MNTIKSTLTAIALVASLGLAGAAYAQEAPLPPCPDPNSGGIFGGLAALGGGSLHPSPILSAAAVVDVELHRSMSAAG